MKWLKRGLVALAILAIVSGVGLVVLVRFLPETDFIRNAVEQRLRDLTGQNITIASIQVGGSFPDVMRITLTGIAATAQDGHKQLSMDRLVLVPSLGPLFHREISIGSITVEGLHTSIRRLPDGSVQYPLVVAPVSSPPSGPQETTGPAQNVAKESPAPASAGLRWSIETVTVTRGTVDFIDRQATPEGDGVTAISLKDLKASLKQQKSGNAFSAILSTRLEGAGVEAGSVELTGEVTLTPNLSDVQRATATISSESLALAPFQRYIPIQPELLAAFRLAKTRFTGTWEKSKPFVYSLESSVTGKGEAPRSILVKGTGNAAEDFSRMEGCVVTAETSEFPLGTVADLLPQAVPWQTSSALLSAHIKGQWQQPAAWTVQGEIGLADLAPKGMLAAFGKKMSLKAQAVLDPAQLSIKNMEISEDSHKLAGISGTVHTPLSDARTFDLTADSVARPQWLRALGVRLPAGVAVGGSVPLRARVKGTAAKLAIDVKGDLTAAALRVIPVIDKPEGEKATLSVQTAMTNARRKDGSRAPQALHVALHIPSTRIRFRPQGPALAGQTLNLTAGVFIRGKSVDVKDAVVTLKRAQGKSPDEIVINADVDNVESALPKIRGNVTALLNKELIAAAAGNLPPNFKLTGETRGKLALAGTPRALDWNLDLPLTSVGIDVENTFQKPAGVSSNLKASGKWADDALNMERGSLTLSGISAFGRGVLKERNGGFGGLHVQVKKADLKDVAKFVPSLSRVKLSGPVEADLDVKPERQEIVPHGTLRLVAVDYLADKNEWSLRKLRGVAKINGKSLSVPELVGNMGGAVDAPLKVTGNLHNIDSVKDLNGRVTLEMGKGRIKGDRLRKFLQPVQLLVGTLLDPKALTKKTDLLELESLTGTFDIKSGTAQTSNVKLKGADFGAGAIGSIRLTDMHLDALVGLHTVLVTNDAIGRIPQVRSVVKKYEGILKATGLDKELKKVGIDVDAKPSEKQESSKEVRTPVTVIVKVQGTASKPDVMPVAEDSLGRETATKLKSLMN